MKHKLESTLQGEMLITSDMQMTPPVAILAFLPPFLWSSWLLKHDYVYHTHYTPDGSDGKASVYNEGDLGSISVSGRSPGEGNGSPLQYYCLENPMDGGVW